MGMELNANIMEILANSKLAKLIELIKKNS